MIATTFVGALSGAATSATTAGTVTTAAQPNITSVGTLTSLGVNGTVTAVAFTANTGIFTGNGSGLSAIAGGNVTGTVASATSATNASALLQNTSTATSVFPTFSTSSANGNSSAVVSTGISANLGNSSITATTFVGALSGNATTAGTVVTAAQPNITSVGTLTSLNVSGNANVGNLGTAQVLATANVTAPQLISNVGTGTAPMVVSSTTKVANLNADLLDGYDSASTATAATIVLRTGDGSIIGNLIYGAGNNLSNIQGANVTGAVASATTAGTVTTAAQPNITSVGTLTSATVTGNVAAGNLTTTGVLSVTGTGVSSIGGNLDMTSNTIINLATPTNSTDAATKQYVDDVAQGLNIHDSVAAATSTTLATTTGGTITYNNGSSGVGANLVTTGTFNLIDGVNVQTAGTRILVKNEANAVLNGIYTWSNATVITRATDYDSVPEVEAGDFVFVTGGTLYDNTGWVQTSTVTAIGTAGNNIDFTQFSGAGTYTAGTGLTLTGSSFSVNASQTQVTSVGTLGSLAVTGNANVGNLNATTAVVASTLTSNVATGTAPLTVTSTTRVNNLNVAYANVADNINVVAGTGNNFIIFANAATGNVAELTSTGLTANLSNNSIAATTFVGALSGAATTAGTVTTAAQPNITSVGTLTSATVSGNSNLPVININRVNSAVTGINWYSTSYDTWQQYMSPAGATGAGTRASLTVPSGTLVTSWGLRSYIEDAAGYGWTFESGTGVSDITPTVVAEIRSSDGAARFGSVQTPTLTTGANTTAGTVTGNWTLTAGSRWQATYADLAENYAADATYEPGTVLAFGGEQEVTLANAFDSTKVAGVVTTNPAYSMNAALEAEYVAEIALQGRVPCKVIGPIEKGDLMVSASNGHATANNDARAGTIIGKALENFSGDFGVIEVAVGRF